MGRLPCGSLASLTHSYPSSISRGGPFCLSSTCLWGHEALLPAGMPDLSSWHFECSLLAPLSSADPEAVICQMVPTSLQSLLLGKQLCQTISVAFFPSLLPTPPAKQATQISKPGRNQSPSVLRMDTLFLSFFLVGCELCVPET